MMETSTMINSAEKKKHSDYRILMSIMVTVLIVGGIYGYFVFSGGGAKHSVVTISNITPTQKSTEYRSQYIKETNYKYQEAESRNAEVENKSFIGDLGTSVKTKRVIPAETKTENTSLYNFNTTEKKKTAKTSHASDNDSSSPNPSQLNSDTVKDRLDDLINNKLKDAALKTALDAMKSDGHKTNDAGFVTVTTPQEIKRLIPKVVVKATSTKIGEILAGTLYYGYMVSSLDSDYKTTIVTKIAEGKYRGATLIGSFTAKDDWVTDVQVKYNRMNWQGMSFTVNAVAVSDKYLPNIADDVNNHWVSRVGGLLGAGLLSGLSEPFKGNNRPVIIAKDGGSTDQYYTAPDVTQIIGSGIGGIGTTFATIMKKQCKTRALTAYVKRLI